MKVLMLGWEFPPHISGGLGTACAGLTQALEKEQVHVLFVVPKLHGGESVEGTTFINASSIPIRQEKQIGQDSNTPRGHAAGLVSGSSKTRIEKLTTVTRTTIEVPSFLTPYHSPDEHYNVSEFSQWNYSLKEEEKKTLSSKVQSPDTASDRGQEVRIANEPYQFSGSYVANLLEGVVVKNA